MKKILFFIFIFSFAYSQDQSLKYSDWKNYTSLLSINSLSSSGADIWGATNGGVFQYNTSSKNIKRYTNVDGLSSLESSSILADTKNRVWVGGTGGEVDVFFPETNKWINLKDISVAYSGLSKKINGFLQKNDSIYVLSDFGISVYDFESKEFRDSYIKLGGFAAFTPVIDLCMGSKKIFALTPFGLATADKNNKNLLSPDAWSSYEKSQYFENQTMVDIEIRNDNLYVLTNNAIFKQSGDTFVKISSLNQESKKILLSGNDLYIAQIFQILSLNSNDVISPTSIPIQNSITSGFYSNGKIWLSSAGSGLAEVNNNKVEFINLNCPESNSFSKIIISSDGALWATSSGLGGGSPFGFYKFKDGIWKNYNRSNNPELNSDAFCAIHEGENGSIYAGSYGGGIVKIYGEKIESFTTSNSTLVGTVDNPNFIPITGITKDNSGNLWITNYKAVNNNALNSFSTKSEWKSYPNSINSTSNSFFRGLVVDEYGTKWIISEYDPVYNGLFYFNEKYTLPGTVSGWGFISNEEIYSGASNSQVQCVAIDKNGELWIGTVTGLSVISRPSNPAGSISKPCFTTRCNISGQVINTIAVDPLNNKWVGTKSTGIWVLSPDGSSVITQLNSENSFLPDNNIKSITIDPKTGYVYAGTDKGLSSFKTYLVEPLPEFSDNLKVYPNPFNPEKSTLSIDGLIESSNIKVISPYGKMIRTFEAPGGRLAYWDGKDENDVYVATGIYFVIAYSSDGKKSSIGKVAVVRSN